MQPIGGLAEQPAGDTAAAVGGLDVQVADVGEAVLGDQAAGVTALLDLQVPDRLVVEQGGRAGAVDPQRAGSGQSGQR